MTSETVTATSGESMGQASPVLDVSGLTLRRRGHKVAKRGQDQDLVSNFDLRMDRGDLLVLLGPNGAGKSSLLACLAGLLPPFAGSVRLAGRSLYHGKRSRTAVRREVALLHQEPLLFDRSVLANVAYGLVRRRVPGAKDLALDALRLAGIDALCDRPARSLSGGETRRVALVQALVLPVSVLLLDEPSPGLDQAALEWLFRSIEGATTGSIEGATTGSIEGATPGPSEYVTTRRAVIVATHDESLADRLGSDERILG